MSPRVRAVPAHDLEVDFDNGEVRRFDVKQYLDRGVFVRLRDPDAFRDVGAVAGSIERGEWARPQLRYRSSRRSGDRTEVSWRRTSRCRGPAFRQPLIAKPFDAPPQGRCKQSQVDRGRSFAPCRTSMG